MTKPIVTYLAILAAFLLLDAVWLGLVARQFYASRLGDLLAPNVQWWAAILFYLLFAAGILHFVVGPRSAGGTPAGVFVAGAFFGLVTYAAYDLTNQAVLRGWPPVITIVDLAWGAVLTGTVSTVGWWVARRFV
jgi:uncharacterized membrane protein